MLALEPCSSNICFHNSELTTRNRGLGIVIFPDCNGSSEVDICRVAMLYWTGPDSSTEGVFSYQGNGICHGVQHTLTRRNGLMT